MSRFWATVLTGIPPVGETWPGPVLADPPSSGPPAWPHARRKAESHSMAVATLSPARALRRPRRADPRAIVGVFLTLAALAGSVAFWVSATDARPVLIAARDLPAGATLTAADLGIAYIRADDAVYRAALPSDNARLTRRPSAWRANARPAGSVASSGGRPVRPGAGSGGDHDPGRAPTALSTDDCSPATPCKSW